jgi:hypothetical protein
MSAPFIGSMDWIKQERARLDRLKLVYRLLQLIIWLVIGSLVFAILAAGIRIWVLVK